MRGYGDQSIEDYFADSLQDRGPELSCIVPTTISGSKCKFDYRYVGQIYVLLSNYGLKCIPERSGYKQICPRIYNHTVLNSALLVVTKYFLHLR